MGNMHPVSTYEVREESIGLLGFVVIDSLLRGSGTGGIRMAEGITQDEVARLAREMTLKFAFLNIKKGGAKAGIVMPKECTKEQKKALCYAFGEKISHLLKEKRYFPGEDLGINFPDLDTIFEGAKIRYHSESSLSSERYTALTVFLSILTLLRQRSYDAEKITVAIEGFGKTGEQLAIFLSGAGIKVAAVSTIKGGIYNKEGLDIPLLSSLKSEFGDECVFHYPNAEKIEKTRLFFLEVDVLVPGARADSINEQNISGIRAHTIIPIANICATEDIEKRLDEIGKTYIPGFVSNCGGILGYFLSEQGLCPEDVEREIREVFPKKVEKLLRRARKNRTFSADQARKWSDANFRRMAGKPSLFSRLSPAKIIFIHCKKILKRGKNPLCLYCVKKYLSDLIMR